MAGTWPAWIWARSRGTVASGVSTLAGTYGTLTVDTATGAYLYTPNAAAIDAIMRELAVKHPKLINQPAWSEMKLYLETNAPPQPLHTDNLGDASEF